MDTHCHHTLSRWRVERFTARRVPKGRQARRSLTVCYEGGMMGWKESDFFTKAEWVIFRLMGLLLLLLLAYKILRAEIGALFWLS